MKEFLLQVLKSRTTREAWEWFEEATQATAPPSNRDRVLAYYTGASRRLGKMALLLDESEKARLSTLRPLLTLNHWGADEAGRAILLLSLTYLPPDEYASLVLECYEQGDSREQQSWLRALSLLPGCERFLETAIDACRTNIRELFESIACENPYPVLYFPDLNLNQLVLKSLFNGIALSRIVGLESRFNHDLSRMANDYVSEREAAHRDVPPDIWFVVAPKIEREGLLRVRRYLQHDNQDHRYWAAVGLGLSGDPANREPLSEVRNGERDARVRQAIDASLEKLGH